MSTEEMEAPPVRSQGSYTEDGSFRRRPRLTDFIRFRLLPPSGGLAALQSRTFLSLHSGPALPPRLLSACSSFSLSGNDW